MVIFIFKQKTAYEMRISDWSSDVCSSDLQGSQREGPRGAEEAALDEPDVGGSHGGAQLPRLDPVDPLEEAQQDQARHQARAGDSRCRSLRPREGEGAHPRIPRRAAAQDRKSTRLNSSH